VQFSIKAELRRYQVRFEFMLEIDLSQIYVSEI
jgi:hypothetical protein